MFWSIMSICAALLAASCAGVCLMLASRSTSIANSARLALLKTSDLESLFEELLESHKTLRSRVGMREVREKGVAMRAAANAAPAPGASKAELRDYYLKGKTPAEVAAIHRSGVNTNV